MCRKKNRLFSSNRLFCFMNDDQVSGYIYLRHEISYVILWTALLNFHCNLSLSCVLTFRDRFRTTVNVLGDTFGVGIVQHYSRKQLGPLPSTSDHSTTAFSTLPDTLASQHHDSYDQLHVSSDGVGNTKNQLSQYGSALAYDSDSPPSHIIPSPDTLRRSLSPDMVLESNKVVSRGACNMDFSGTKDENNWAVMA